MAVTDRSLTGSISGTKVTGVLNSRTGLTGILNSTDAASVKDYDVLINKPKINGVELSSNKSFEDLGFSELSEIEVYELLDKVWKG